VHDQAAAMLCAATAAAPCCSALCAERFAGARKPFHNQLRSHDLTPSAQPRRGPEGGAERSWIQPPACWLLMSKRYPPASNAAVPAKIPWRGDLLPHP